MASADQNVDEEMSEHSLGWLNSRESEGDEDATADAYGEGNPSQLLTAEDPQTVGLDTELEPDIQLHEPDRKLDLNPINERVSGFTDTHSPNDAERPLIAGSKFSSWVEFDEALDEYEGKTGWVLRRLSRNKSRVHARCRGWEEGSEQLTCQVQLSARCMKATGMITIQNSFLIHTCPVSVHKWRSGANKSRWVSRKIQPQVMINHDATVKQLRESMVQFHGTDSKSWSLQRARRHCRANGAGGGGLSFSKIPAYCELVQKEDVGAHVIWEATEDSRFQRIYIAPSSSRHAFNFCRPFVGLDGTHTVGDFAMTILLATCYDGENHVLILAWAVVNKENSNNWIWFLQHLRASYPKMVLRDTVFVSDRDKGLILGVKEAFNDPYHSYCTQHIKGNVQAFSDVSCGAFFVKVAKASTKVEYDHLLDQFAPTSDRQKAVVPYIKNIDPCLYARHAFPSPRWGHTTSNVVEVVNHAIKKIHKLPALHICEELWNYVMVKHFERSTHASALPSGPGGLTQYANDMYCEIYRESQSVLQQPSSDTQALMIDRHGNWALKISKRHCDCGAWLEMSFPCAHVLRFEGERGRDAKNLVGSYWTATNQRITYEVPLPPMSIDRLIASDTCMEPILSSSRKRQRKVKRTKSRWESQMAEHQRLVNTRMQKCGNCGRQEHNRRGCLLPQQDPALLRSGEAEIIHVMAVHSITRANVQQAWTVYNTRPSTQSFAEWFNETHSQPTPSQSDTSPSQVTQV